MYYLRTNVHLLAAFTALLLIEAAAVAAAESPTRPNIVLVFVDDAGYADFPYFRDDHPRTPNIDRLCDEGLRFTQFYVNAPICSPSRVAFVTGQYPARWGITSFIASSQENARRGMCNWLDPAAPSLARSLQESGYATGHFGKWHLGGGRDVGDAPLIAEYGFDESLTQFEGLGDRILPLMDSQDGQPPTKLPLGVASAKLGHGEVRWVDRDDETAVFVKSAIEFIQEAKSSKRPFYVNLWPDDVHTPLQPPHELRGDDSKRALYLGVLENMDRQLGELFNYIRDDAELSKNTVIIVASDNGFEQGAGSAGDLRGAKGILYEGGVREPLIVWGPGVLAERSAGATNDETVFSSVDVVQSLLTIAGAEASPTAELDGEDLSPTLLGAERQRRSKPLFWNRPPDRPHFDGNDAPDLAIRDGQWKLLLEYDGEKPQLYDIAADPNETKNLAKEQPEVTARLKAQLLKWHQTLPAAPEAAVSGRQFTNPICEGADPWVTQHDGKYLACMSEGNRAISVHISDDLTNLGPKNIVWRAPSSGPYSKEIWAPELHRLDGRWYIYFAASDGDNRNHLSYALESEGDDPLGPYELHGPIYTGDDPEQKNENRWAIDATVLELPQGRYLLWSGWEDDRDEQWLYIAPMKSPWELSGPRVKLCHNADHLWERVAENAVERGLHEGPQVLQRDDRTFIVYSTSSSWQPTYKLGMLELKRDGDPLNPADWVKFDQPAFSGTDQTYGVGHASFVKSPDGTEDWIVYHAKQDREDGWRRAVFVQPFTWGPKGRPLFGSPVAAGDLLDMPSGTPVAASDETARSFPTFESLDEWIYFGHHQMWEVREGVLHLGVQPKPTINGYRSGEKVILNDADWANVCVAATIRIEEGDRDAGILFRVQRPAVGYDAQEGYFAGIIPGSDRVVLGATDGVGWRHIADADANIELDRDYRLLVTARGEEIVVTLDGKRVIQATDDAYRRGTVGLRVVDSTAAFSDVEIKPLRKTKRSRQKRKERADASANN